jgi:hypothetical protein
MENRRPRTTLEIFRDRPPQYEESLQRRTNRSSITLARGSWPRNLGNLPQWSSLRRRGLTILGISVILSGTYAGRADSDSVIGITDNPFNLCAGLGRHHGSAVGQSPVQLNRNRSDRPSESDSLSLEACLHSVLPAVERPSKGNPAISEPEVGLTSPAWQRKRF